MIFLDCFRALTGHEPFPWQEALYKCFKTNEIPSSCNLPTGLGKTSVIAIWLIALAEGVKTVPRRLVYVVNRRTVVDQTTTEVESIRDRLLHPDQFDYSSILEQISSKLIEISALKDIPLAISTLRGQFADNREWSADPSRPAVICGTVDMIGSRLLFSGYGAGFKTRPMYAGFLGQDALLIHDEAHLEPAFQALVENIVKEQERERGNNDESPWPGLKVMQLTATRRNGEGKDQLPFSLTPGDLMHEEVKKRIKACKRLSLQPVDDEKKVTSEIVKIAEGYKDQNAAVLVFARTVEAVETIGGELQKKTKKKTILLTGTMRGKERDELVDRGEFKRFLKNADGGETVYIICTSAGEVGIDISADHMVCDLTPFDSMAQRLGRVNRYGGREANVRVVYPEEFDGKDKLKDKREATLKLLQELNGDASPLALLTKLDENDKAAAYTPPPTILPVTDILFDAWSLTTIRNKMPGRSPVEPYLHGVAEWQRPETQVAWRDEVELITGELIERHPPDELLEDFPLKPHELLRDRTDRIMKALKKIAEKNSNAPVWIIDARNQVSVTTLDELTEGKKGEDVIAHATILLPPSVGGLEAGTLDENAEHKKEIQYDVACEWLDDHRRRRRTRVWSDSREPEPPEGKMRLVRVIDEKPDMDELGDQDEPGGKRFWHWYIRPYSADDDLSKTYTNPVTWDHHTNDVAGHAIRIADALLKDQPNLHKALILAATWHDLGKKREAWQRSIGNPNPADWHAKSGKDPSTGKKWTPIDCCPNYRHEFGSLLDVLESDEARARLSELGEEMRDVVLHLIAAHHGYARPHFPLENAYDPDRPETEAEEAAIETPRRFARLQRKYGRWRLAYLESLLRAADYAASAAPSAFADEPENADKPEKQEAAS